MSAEIPVRLARLPHADPALPPPAYETAGAAGMDLRACLPEAARASGAQDPLAGASEPHADSGATNGEREVVVVQSQRMRRWLTLELARRLPRPGFRRRNAWTA